MLSADSLYLRGPCRSTDFWRYRRVRAQKVIFTRELGVELACHLPASVSPCGIKTTPYESVRSQLSTENFVPSYCPSKNRLCEFKSYIHKIDMAHCSTSATCDSAKTMHVSVLSVFAFLALVSVIFRLWARRIKKIRLEMSDYLCFAGFVHAIPKSA